MVRRSRPAARRVGRLGAHGRSRLRGPWRAGSFELARRRPRPGPQRGAASGAGSRDDARAGTRRRARDPGHRRRLDRRQPRHRRQSRAHRPPHSPARQSRRPYAQRAQHRPARSPRHVCGPHGRPRALSRAITSREASRGSSRATSPARRARSWPWAIGRPAAPSRSRSRARSAWEARASAAPHRRRRWTRASAACGDATCCWSWGAGTRSWPVNQDGELAARIRAGGGRIVCVPAMAARYVARSNLRTLARQYWRYGQYRVKTARRHPVGLRRSHVLPPGLVASLRAPHCPRRRARPLRRAVVLYGGACWPRASVSRGDARASGSAFA